MSPYLIDPIVIYTQLNMSINVWFPRIFKPEQFHYVTRFFTTLHHLLKPVWKCRVRSRNEQKKKISKSVESRVHIYFLFSNPHGWNGDTRRQDSIKLYKIPQIFGCNSYLFPQIVLDLVDFDNLCAW